MTPWRWPTEGSDEARSPAWVVALGVPIGFLAWAVADRLSLKHRTPRPTPALPASRFNDVIAVVAGLVLYAVFVMWAHVRLFGVAPMG